MWSLTHKLLLCSTDATATSDINLSQEKMKTRFWSIVLVVGMAANSRTQAQTNFTITTPDAQFAFMVDNDTNTNPTLTLTAGVTYSLTINTTPALHPVDITTATTFPYLNNAYSGADMQTITTGTITLTIPPTNFPSTLFYICNNHGFFGQMNVLPPAAVPPPPNTIVSIVLGPTNVTVTSTGTTTTYTFVPQFSSNLLASNWLDVSNFANITNTFDGATNTTVFDRLDSICGSNVFIRISQRPPD